MNKTQKRHFEQGHFSKMNSQFKLEPRPSLGSTHYKNATSVQLGLLKQQRFQRRVDQRKNQSTIVDMIPARDDVQRSRRRLSPSKYRDHRDMLTYSVDLGRSQASVQRESSYDSFQNKTSQSGFYQRPQVSISQTRLKEASQSIRVLVPQRTNELKSILQKYSERAGMKECPKTGISCRVPRRIAQMDALLYQQRDAYGRKQWFCD